MGLLAALSAGRAFLLGAVTALFLLVAGVAALAGFRRARGRDAPDIPRGMQPGPSDFDLEKPVLEKHIGWGALLIVFIAIWVPFVWLQEPQTNADDTRLMLRQSIERGRLTTMPGSEQNQIGFNCQRCHGPGLRGGQNVFNSNIVSVPDLTTVCGGADFNHPQIAGLDDVINTIAQGRPGTDMPSWSVRFAGAMTDEQINDLVNYILSIQRVPKNKNLCLNPPQSTAPAGARGGPSPSPQATPTTGGTPTPAQTSPPAPSPSAGG